ncbi:MAG: LicD family protein [Methanobrevibacter thaueri]|nr:LicD family protein [Methanobrevibacter thaueri]
MFNIFKNKKKVKKTKKPPTKTEFNQLKKLLNTHQDYLNNIYLHHELEPARYMELMRSISFELFKFFDYVCEKHNIEYWLDFGTLLGAVRHEGFIPWDDDLDVGMIRSEYLRFVEIIQEEIDNSGLIDVVAVYKVDVRDRISRRWFQIEFRRPEFRGKFIGIDIFPYDFIVDPEDIEEKFYESRAKFFKRRTDGLNIHQVVEKVYGELNLTFEKQDYVIPGVEDVRGNVDMYDFCTMQSDKIFPYKKVKFGGKTYNAPNDTDYYLKKIYGKKYMKIPNNIHDHRRLNRYIKQPNIMNMLEESNNMIIEVNRNLNIK